MTTIAAAAMMIQAVMVMTGRSCMMRMHAARHSRGRVATGTIASAHVRAARRRAWNYLRGLKLRSRGVASSPGFRRPAASDQAVALQLPVQRRRPDVELFGGA